MTTSITGAKHRAARRPISQVLADAAGDNLATAGRRSAIVAASSGLIVSMLATPANAAPTDVSSTSVGSTDVNALTKQAREQLAAAPAVKVADVEWSATAAVVEAVTVTPAPEPEPVVVTAAASRTAERTTTAAAATTAEATTEAAPEAAAAEPAAAPEVTVENTAPPAAAAGSAIIEIASRYVGVPYVYGGSTPSGFDCSGFTSYVFAQAGISLPRSSASQRNVGTVVARADAQPGDLIWSPGHVAIYAGGDTQIDAPRPGKTVQFRAIWQSDPIFIRVG